MSEVVIGNPSLNNDNLRAHGYNIVMREILPNDLFKMGVTPTTHPKAIDLCAGDGSLARILVDNGWKATDMTCVDRCQTDTALVLGTNWRYWDLEEIIKLLDRQPESIPEQVSRLAHRFDIAMLMNGELLQDDPWSDRLSRSLCRYFVRPGGLVYTTTDTEIYIPSKQYP